MDKLKKIKTLLADIGMPSAQQSDLCALTILALANLREIGGFSSATNNWLRIHDIITFINNNYAVNYAENSRETIRKQAIHHFRTAALIEDNGKPTNSPNYKYRLTEEFLKVIKETKKSTDDNSDNEALKSFKRNHETLINTYTSKKAINKLPDIILYREDKDWIYFIEAMDSVGPMSPERVIDIKKMTSEIKSGKIFVTAFLSFAKFKRFSEKLAWETEVWIADMPEHMIHLNGDNFMGPR